MKRVVIRATGVEIPEGKITNDELVDSYNTWADVENVKRKACARSLVEHSSAEFIRYASGVEQRHVLDVKGVLDPKRMAPHFPKRGDDELSLMAEFGCKAARKAIHEAAIEASSIDLVICAASHIERPYPAIAIEIQNELGAQGVGFDMSLGCSSVGAALHVAQGLVRAGVHNRVLIVSPEIISGQLDFRDRQTHFIFGDAAVAILVEGYDNIHDMPENSFEIIDTCAFTQFSNNIRSNFGFLCRAGQEKLGFLDMEGLLIKQNGNKVFKEVTSAAHQFIRQFLSEQNVSPQQVRRYWLHQANNRMNGLILKLLLGEVACHDRAPMVLSRFGNTAAAGAVIAFHENRDDLERGALGMFCAFGAGYSMAGALLRKV